MTRSLSLILFALLTGCAATAQTPEASGFTYPADPLPKVRGVVLALFDGMRAGDSTAVRAALHPAARFETVVRSDDGEGYQRIEGSVEGFIRAVGTPHEEVWDERIDDMEIRVDAGLATAWMAYRFYLGREFSHCGVNSMQLVKTEGVWQILNLVDTRRQGCE